MPTLVPLPGFDWSRVFWAAPDEPPPETCSVCAAVLPEESVPLMLWTEAGACAAFCDACQRRWWGIETFEGSQADEW